jgi:hypothetical protein
MVEKDMLVTVSLDSCHSGGAVRGESRPLFRGLDRPDTSELVTDVPTVDVETVELMTSIQSVTSKDEERPWLLEPHGFTLLAACAQHEKAQEMIDANGDYYGAFTYWLVDTLLQDDGTATCQMVCNRLSSKIRHHHQQWPQTAVCAGLGHYPFLGSIRKRAINSIGVEVSTGQGNLLLNTGQVHGVQKGDTYSIYPWNSACLGEEIPLASVQIVDVKELTSIASILQADKPDQIETGCRAILKRRRHYVQLRFSNNVAPETQMLFPLKEYENNITPIVLIGENDRNPPSYLVSAADNDGYKLLYANNDDVPHAPVKRRPEDLLKQVAHVAQHHMILNLKSERVGFPRETDFVFQRGTYIIF